MAQRNKRKRIAKNFFPEFSIQHKGEYLMNVGKVSFTGYKNVMSMRMEHEKDNITMMAMQLDNVGERDLDNWIKIQKQLYPNRTPKDTFTMMHSADANGTFTMTVNGRTFATGKNRHFITPKEEAPMLDMYGMMMRINERIMNGEKWQVDSGLSNRVVPNCINMFNKLELNPRVSMALIDSGVAGARRAPEIAAKMNDSINDLVDGYFDSYFENL